MPGLTLTVGQVSVEQSSIGWFLFGQFSAASMAFCWLRAYITDLKTGSTANMVNKNNTEKINSNLHDTFFNIKFFSKLIELTCVKTTLNGIENI